MFSKTFVKKCLLASASTALLVVGSAVVANAATANTTISDWTTGSVGSYRTANVSVNQSITAGSHCVANEEGGNQPAITVKSAQFQLQKNSGGPVPTSYGNMTGSCTTALKWGSGLSGSFRYQLNAITGSDGTYYNGAGEYLFSSNNVVIQY